MVNLNDIKPVYFSPNENVAKEVLIPLYQKADTADCMVGFFSSESLVVIAPGLASYIQSSQRKMRLVISPHLSDADRLALEEGLKTHAELAEDYFTNAIKAEHQLINFTLRSLSHLLMTNRLEIKIAFLRGALFHPKVWLFGVSEGVVAVHGSSNFTFKGFLKNYEQISISKSWSDSDQKFVVEKFQEQFTNLWNNEQQNCVVLDLPRALREGLVNRFSSSKPPSEEELSDLFENLKNLSTLDSKRAGIFHIPPDIDYRTGNYEHQGKAVDAWNQNSQRGILSMATGSGKTITAMIGAYHLYKKRGSLFIVISAPYKPLLNQWEEEVKLFGLTPINLSGISAVKRKDLMNRVVRRLNHDVSTIEVVLISHDSVNTADFSSAISKIKAPRLLIGDEVHNLGRPSFKDEPPELYEYRLGLSATPIRQYDSEGTDFLLKYFGEIVFEYSLSEAIGRCLVPYHYIIHPIILTEEEMDNWSNITHQIANNSWRMEDGKPDDYLKAKYRERRLVLESASNKIEELSRLLESEDSASLKHTLIYCTDKNPQQMLDVNKLLDKQKISYRKITDEESSDPKLTKMIINEFKSEEIKILTAKRVLDEGVNIPQISMAYILASTTVERQWVQRRGRLLRRSTATNKTISIIHDFIVLPPSSADSNSDSLIKSELLRVEQFASLAANANHKGGPISLIHELRKRLFF
ncbi:MAG: DEAD/DEAH box helicase family protein [Deltaproteobacteria bacterium]|jgi:superfamily II DNA or RNA helicase|nr:DEAD/DEAH box helicase family protein [Deltaproteobacteria bacterium]